MLKPLIVDDVESWMNIFQKLQINFCMQLVWADDESTTSVSNWLHGRKTSLSSNIFFLTCLNINICAKWFLSRGK